MVEVLHHCVVSVLTSQTYPHSSPTPHPLPTHSPPTPTLIRAVKNEGKGYAFCGGGYIKLHKRLTELQQHGYGGDTPYALMFGPDLCGHDVAKIQLILATGTGVTLARKDEIELEYDDKDDATHLYTLIMRADKTYGNFRN